MLYEYLFLFVGMTLLYLVGVCDDLVGVGYRYKFAVQIVSALLLVLSGNWFGSLGGLFGVYSVPAWVGIPVTVFIVVYITNAINLIDGIDGLASGLCSIALSVLSVIFFIRMQYVYALLAICTLGVLMPFWCYNVFGNANRGHKLFMGDPSVRVEPSLTGVTKSLYGDRFLHGLGPFTRCDPCGASSPS